MERTVGTHIRELERIVRQLNEELMQQKDVRMRNELEAKARAAETALSYYRNALVLEQSILRSS